MSRMNFSRSARGFTLVEMSIVLVIIGLIIGGILKGQEIIASARQKAVINQANAVRAAMNTYFDRYRALPGDDPAGTSIDASVNNGNGNGVVGAAATSIATLGTNAGNAGENYVFFNGLIAANLLNGGQVTPAATVNSNTFGNSALPASPISGAGLTVIYGPHAGTGTGTQKTTHWLRVHKNAAAPTASLSPRTMANIDNQIDDGLPGNGGVRSGVAAGAAACDLAGGTYNVSDDLLCIPLFELAQ